MYQENNNTISWLKIVVKILLAFLLVILAVKIFSLVINTNKENKQEDIMSSNLSTMMTVAKDYFKEDKLPKEVGSSVKVDLETLIKDKKIDSIKDASGDKCDTKESFIKATKLDKEYQIKAYLVCGKETDYLNEFVKGEENITIKPTTTTTTKKTTTKKTTEKKTTNKNTTKTTTTTKKNTTKKTTKKVTTSTTAKKYKVTFNSNGGSTINSVTVKENNTIKVPQEPTRAGYKFVGWYYHGVKFDFNTKISQDYILVAKWTK